MTLKQGPPLVEQLALPQGPWPIVEVCSNVGSLGNITCKGVDSVCKGAKGLVTAWLEGWSQVMSFFQGLRAKGEEVTVESELVGSDSKTTIFHWRPPPLDPPAGMGVEEQDPLP